MALQIPDTAGFVTIDTTSLKTIVLPISTDRIGRVLTFKDRNGFANLNPITLQTQGSDTFQDGSITYTLQDPYASITLISRPGQWIETATISQGSTSFSTGSLYVSTIDLQDNYLYASNATLFFNGSTLVDLTTLDQSISSFSTSLGYVSGEVTRANLLSTIKNLGSQGYVSSLSLISTVGTLQSNTITSLNSSITGLGSAGYISTLSLISTVSTVQANMIKILNSTTSVTSLNILSTVAGLGSAQYISTGQLTSTTSAFTNALISTTQGLGTAQYISTGQLISTNVGTAYAINSTVIGLGSAQYVSTGQLISTNYGLGTSFNSTTQGLGNLGYISTLSLISTVTGVTTSIVSTNDGVVLSTSLGVTATTFSTSFGFASQFVSTNSLISTVQALNVTTVSTAFGLQSSLLSTSYGLTQESFSSFYGTTITTFSTSYGFASQFVSTNSLVSTTYVLNSNILSTNTGSDKEMISTVAGLGTEGYLSSLSLISSVTGIQLQLTSTVNSLGSRGYISTSRLASTVQGLGSAGYVSTSYLQSTVEGLNLKISSQAYFIPGTQGAILYFNKSVGLNANGHNKMQTVPTSVTQQTQVSTFSARTSNVMVCQFETDFTLPAFIPSGFWDFNIWVTATNIANVYYYPNVYLKNGAETLIVSGSNSPTQILTDTLPLQYTTTLEVPYSTLIGFSSIMVKIMATNADNQAQTVTMFYEDGSYSHVHTTFGTIYPNTQIASTIEGLGTYGYISTLSFLSSSVGRDGQLTSTVGGLGSAGYVSTASFFSAITNFQTNSLTALNSSLIGLGTLGYVSTFSLVSTSFGISSNLSTSQYYQNVSLGSLGYVSSLSLQSTVEGLGSLGYISTLSLTSTQVALQGEIMSSLTGLGSLGYVSTLSLTSTQVALQGEIMSSLTGLGSLGYVSTFSLMSTSSGIASNLSTNQYYQTISLGSSGYVSTLSLTSTQVALQGEIMSSLTGLGSLGYVSTFSLISTSSGITSNLSTNQYYQTISLGSAGYISTLSLTSTQVALQGEIMSTATGLGTLGYISTLSLTSTQVALQGEIGSTIAGLGQNYVSTSFLGNVLSSISSTYGSSFVTSNLYSLNGYISSLSIDQLILGDGSGWADLGPLRALVVSTLTTYAGSIVATQGDFQQITASSIQASNLIGIVATADIVSTVTGLGSSGYVSSLSLVSTVATVQSNASLALQSTVKGLGSVGYISSSAFLISTSAGIQKNIGSSIIGLGSLGYISSSGFLISTSYGLQHNLASIGYVSSSQLASTTQGLRNYISSFIDPTELASTITSLGTEGFVSSIGLLSTSQGLADYIMTFVDPAELASTVTGLGTSGLLSSFSTLIGSTSNDTLYVSSLYVSSIQSPDTLAINSKTLINLTASGSRAIFGYDDITSNGGITLDVGPDNLLLTSESGGTTTLQSKNDGTTNVYGGFDTNIRAGHNINLSTGGLYSADDGSDINLSAQRNINQTATTINLSATTLNVTGSEVINYTGTTSFASYGAGIDTLNLVTPVDQNIGGTASLFFGAKQYPLGRIAAVDSTGQGDSALVFQTRLAVNNSNLNVFSYTGSTQTYTVPAGVTSITVFMWGGGGGGSQVAGGAGAYVSGKLSVTPGDTYTILVAGGGQYNTTIGGFGGGGQAVQYFGNEENGSGGGRSAIRDSGDTIDLVTAGGGGGSGSVYLGGAATWTGTALSGSGSYPGRGGSQTAGGAAGNTNATAGTQYQGGNANDYCGAGGGGYYGGGGGDNNGIDQGGPTVSSGGGGSSYTANLIGANGANSPDGYTAPGTSSPFYSSGIATGGDMGTNGGNGLVVIASYTLSEAMRIGDNGYVGIGTSSPTTLLDVAGTIGAQIVSTSALYVSSINGQTIDGSILSTVQTLGSLGYISTSGLISTTIGIQRSGFISTQTLQSTVRGLGQTYLSTALSTSYARSFITSSLTTSSIFNQGTISTYSLVVYGASTLTVQGQAYFNTISVAQINLSSIIGVNYVTAQTLTSTIEGLATLGYTSTLDVSYQLSSFSTSVGGSFVNLGTLGYISTSALISSVIGLQTSGFLSTSYFESQISSFSTSLGSLGGPTLYSTVTGLGNMYVSTSGLVSTTLGLQTSGFLSTSYFQSQISSFSTSLGSLGGTTLYSTVTGLGNMYVSTSGLVSTTLGLQTSGFLSTSYFQSQISSFSTSLGSLGGPTLYSTVTGLGNMYVSTPSLVSTTLGLQTSGFLSTSYFESQISSFSTSLGAVGGATLYSTVTGLGNMYISTSGLVSTTLGLQTSGFLSTSYFQSQISSFSTSLGSLGGTTLYSTVTGLGNMYVSTSGLVSTTLGLQTSGFLSTPVIQSTVAGLGQNYISTSGLLSTTSGLTSYINSFIDPVELASTITSLGTVGFISSIGLLSTSQGLANYITSFIDPIELASTVTGLGSVSYISSLQLNLNITSTVANLGQVYVSTSGLVSTTLGLQTSGFLSTPVVQSTVIGLGQIYISTSGLVSTTLGLQTSGFLSTSYFQSQISSFSTSLGALGGTTLYSTVTGLGNMYVSTSGLVSTTLGLQTSGFLSTSYFQSQISSFSTSLGALGGTTLYSTVTGLGNMYVSTSGLVSTTLGLQTSGFLSTSYFQSQISSFSTSLGALGGTTLYSTVTGLGNMYVSTSGLVSTTLGLQTSGFLSTSYFQSQISSFSTSLGALGGTTLYSTVTGLGQIYVSTSYLQFQISSFSTSLGSITSGGITASLLYSTVTGLGQIYVSTSVLQSTIQGLGQTYVSTSYLQFQISSFSTSLGSITSGGGIAASLLYSTVAGLGQIYLSTSSGSVGNTLSISSLGLNCNAPAYLLDVNGQGNISSLIVGATYYPDRVNANTNNAVYAQSTLLYFNNFVIGGARVSQPQTFTF